MNKKETIDIYKSIVFNNTINKYDAKYKLDRFDEPPRLSQQINETRSDFLLRLKEDTDLFKQSFQDVLFHLKESSEPDEWARWYGDFSVSAAVACFRFEKYSDRKPNC